MMKFPRTFENEVVAIDADEIMMRAPDSAAMLDYWDQVDAIVDGIKAMRKAGEKYLPKFADESETEYNCRLKLTKFTNVYRDIVEGLSNKPFEEEISLVKGTSELPTEIVDFIEDVDGAGNNLTTFSQQTFFNGINSAIDWIFVDYPVTDQSQTRTLADQKATGIRPFWSHVLGRNVLEARIKIIAGKETLDYIRIYEPGKPDHVRIFKRDLLGIVTWELWVKSDKPAPGGKTQFVLEATGYISIGIIPLVPFMTGRRDGRTFNFFPAMQDAADLQIELYQQESGLKFIKTLAAYPMLAGNGIKPQLEGDGKTPKKLAIGPGRVLYGAPDGLGNHGEWAYVEPAATSMTFLAADVKDTISQLRELGRQPLTAQSGNLTVITTAVAASKARSAVSAWALMLKDALENALVITAAWLNIQYDPQVNVYTEFDDFADNGNDVTALQTMRKDGDLSQETYWYEMKRRKILSPEFNGEEEERKLLAEVPGDPGLDATEDNSDNPQDM